MKSSAFYVMISGIVMTAEKEEYAMKWNKYTLTTKSEAEDLISSMMMDAGIEGIEIEDKVPLSDSDKAQMFVDILPDAPADDGVARISFYLEPDQDNAAVLAAVSRDWMRSAAGALMWEPVRSKLPRPRIKTGLITGRNISTSFTWMIF